MTNIITNEGRLVAELVEAPNGTIYIHEYFLTDNLGNTRAVFGKNDQGLATIVQEDN